MSFSSGSVVKAGTIQAWGGSTAPFGWLICDGSALSRTLYAALFDVIGETYGGGDGSTTFNLPNLIGLTSDNVPCCGNAISLGLTDGTLKGGLSSINAGNTGTLIGNSNQYGQNVGHADGTNSYLGFGKAVGITTDTTKSGIISSLSSASQKSFAIIKY